MSNLVKLNLLAAPSRPELTTIEVNGQEVAVRRIKPYDELITDIMLAANILITSGDQYIYPFNEEMVTTLVYARAFTNIELEFLMTSEIAINRITEAFDIINPLLPTINEIVDAAQRDFFYAMVAEHIRRNNEYANSAKGIVDALAEHNIVQQDLMMESLQEVDTGKLEMITQFIAGQAATGATE